MAKISTVVKAVIGTGFGAGLVIAARKLRNSDSFQTPVAGLRDGDGVATGRPSGVAGVLWNVIASLGDPKKSAFDLLVTALKGVLHEATHGAPPGQGDQGAGAQAVDSAGQVVTDVTERSVDPSRQAPGGSSQEAPASKETEPRPKASAAGNQGLAPVARGPVSVEEPSAEQLKELREAMKRLMGEKAPDEVSASMLPSANSEPNYFAFLGKGTPGGYPDSLDVPWPDLVSAMRVIASDVLARPGVLDSLASCAWDSNDLPSGSVRISGNLRIMCRNEEERKAVVEAVINILAKHGIHASQFDHRSAVPPQRSWVEQIRGEKQVP